MEETLREGRFTAVRVVACAEHEAIALQQAGLAVACAERRAVHEKLDATRARLVGEGERMPFAERNWLAGPERGHSAEARALGVEEGKLRGAERSEVEVESGGVIVPARLTEAEEAAEGPGVRARSCDEKDGDIRLGGVQQGRFEAIVGAVEAQKRAGEFLAETRPLFEGGLYEMPPTARTIDQVVNGIARGEL